MNSLITLHKPLIGPRSHALGHPTSPLVSADRNLWWWRWLMTPSTHFKSGSWANNWNFVSLIVTKGNNFACDTTSDLCKLLNWSYHYHSSKSNTFCFVFTRFGPRVYQICMKWAPVVLWVDDAVINWWMNKCGWSRQTTSSNEFLWENVVIISLAQYPIYINGPCLTSNRRQCIAYNNYGKYHWHINKSLWENVSNPVFQDIP